jgi:integrase
MDLVIDKEAVAVCAWVRFWQTPSSSAASDIHPDALSFSSAHRALRRGHGNASREIASLRWSDVDGDTLKLAAKNSKNGEARMIPLAGEVGEIIKRRRVAGPQSRTLQLRALLRPGFLERKLQSQLDRPRLISGGDGTEIT